MIAMLDDVNMPLGDIIGVHGEVYRPVTEASSGEVLHYLMVVRGISRLELPDVGESSVLSVITRILRSRLASDL